MLTAVRLAAFFFLTSPIIHSPLVLFLSCVIFERNIKLSSC